MESGLKKLWTRRKSKSNEGRQDSGVGSLRKSQSTEHTLRSVTTSPRSNHTRTTSTDIQYKPSVSNRVQSALGGVVARPSTSWSRPGTDGSGSLMNAVNRAADAVAKAEPEYPYPADRYPKDQVRPKTPRYVDIFSLSNSNSPNSRPGYNEDVAERNLDLARVALEGTHQYVPSSKFQEEVAARNAYPSLPGSDSVDSSPSVRQSGFHGSQSPSQVRGISSPVSSHPQSPRKPGERPFSRHTQNIHSSIGSHSRQQSDRSWDSHGQLHELPASRHSIEDPRQTQTLTSPTTTLASSSHEPMLAHSPPTVPPRHPSRGSGEFQAPIFPNDVLGNYQLSASEVTQVKSNEPFQLQRQGIVTSPDHSTDSQGHSYSVRSPSNLSNASSVKRTINLPNRTIMDLTGNDSEVFSEDSPPSNYSSSPILEHTKVDTMRKVQGAAASRPPTQDGKADTNMTQTTNDSPTGTEQPAAVDVPKSHQPQPESGSELPRSENPPTRSHFAISFSPITTIASASPRASVILEAPNASDRTAETQISPEPVELQNDRDGGGLSAYPKQPTQQNGRSTNPSKNNLKETEKRTSRSDKGNGDGNIAPAESGKTIEPVMEEAPAMPLFDPDHDPDPLPLPRPYIHMAPENLNLIGNVDPVRPSSVSNREFANTPGKSMLTSVPEEVEVKSNGHAKPPGKFVTETLPTGNNLYLDSDLSERQNHTVPGHHSTFDEREYAQKQAEARAALIRLQHSLNENFLTQPTPAPESPSTRYNSSKHAYSFSDGKPATPSSLFSQVRHSSPTSADALGEANGGIEDGILETSYHHLTTVSYEKEGGKAVRKRSSRSAAKSEGPRGKGRQRTESELNGPGPSIINDLESPRQPLHLPPPLRLNGNPIHHHLQYQPPSPGEVSLSNFPIPVSSPRQSVIRPPMADDAERQQTPTPSPQYSPQHPRPTSVAGMKERILRRQTSQRSQASGGSAFSIPFHMIPDRSSSIRDRSVMEADE